MSEMVERVAKAIETYSWSMHGGRAMVFVTDDPARKPMQFFGTFDQAHETCQSMNARAAIEAMREPTEMMLWRAHVAQKDDSSVVREFEGTNPSPTMNRIAWQAMVDAALQPEKEQVE